MALEEEVRSTVINYVLRHLTPRRRAGQKPLEWFEEQFNFVSDEQLKKHVSEAFYQARFSEKMKVALGLKAGFNNSSIKTQIILYASIYEALIDYSLELHKNRNEVIEMCQKTEFVHVKGALAKTTKLIVSESGSDIELILCKIKKSQQSLKEVQFKKRLTTAVAMGIVLEKHQESIQTIYDARNSVHLIKAAASSFTPDQKHSTAAFKNLQHFIKNIRNWHATNPI